ncbi:DUF1573 domain-containing protein [uncultured Flavobacterium sp.]|uniref:DUF1573 domain-containing protein n=1 Tax=uncultured Flavobacterium sp. TaxID=165435 RepID=UPI0030EDB33D|tara:strand:+ start:102458 stop:102904 length:447 start_codon:yes stop_codon:yes gene_type:complete
MKTIKLTIVALFISALSFAQSPEIKSTNVVTKQAASDLKWENDIHDFGTLSQGKPATYEFTFTNTTKETILITNVRPSCGCTAANYTKTPIKPGEKGMVAATYNASAAGAFTKSITVTTSDSQLPKSLTIKGKVDAAPAVEEIKAVLN